MRTRAKMIPSTLSLFKGRNPQKPLPYRVAYTYLAHIWECFPRDLSRAKIDGGSYD